MWKCHKDQVDFSYDEYDFWRVPLVPDVGVSEMGLTRPAEKALLEAGYKKAADIARAFAAGELPKKKGSTDKFVGGFRADERGDVRVFKGIVAALSSQNPPTYSSEEPES